MQFEEILWETREQIGILTMNNPKKANALSIRMVGEMADALTAAAADDSIKVVVIRGAGKHFCGGHDLKEMVDKGVKEYKFIFDHCTRMMQLIHTMPQPVIAQVQGIATAAGCQLVAWCDLAVAEEGAKFATPGVKIGLFCTTPMVAITRAVGRKAAMEMLLTGRYFPAPEAREIGLVNKVVPISDLEKETEAMANRIAEASGYVLGIGKRAFYAQVDETDEKAFQFARHTMVMNLASEDAQNGIKAFLAKEPVEWKNR